MKKITFLLLIGIFWSWCGISQVAIGVQDGTTSAMPISGLWEYSYSQQIVTQSEINADGDITSISFFFASGTNTAPSTKWRIYLGHTSKIQFSSTSDWVLGSELAEVFDGIVTFPAVGNQMLITFDTPFSYNNSDNLVVGITETLPGHGSSLSFGKTTTVPNSYRGIYYRNDNNIPDPNDPPTTGVRENYINTMILGGIQQSCPAPSGLAIANESLTSADLSWVENGSASEWEIVYGLEGFDPQTSGTTILVSGPVSATTLSNLEHSTEYEVYVRAICSDSEQSFLFGPEYFSTLCSATSVPYNLTFEHGANCISIQNAGSGNNWALYRGNTSGFTGIFAGYQFHGSNPGNAWLYTAEISLSAGVEYQISYKYGSSGYNEKMRVAYGTTNDVAAMTTELADHPSITGSVPSINTVTFSVPSSGTYYFGFNAYSAADQNRLMLDDVSIFTAPSCFNPSNLMANNISDSSADLSWDAGQDEDAWSVVYGLEGFDPGTEGTIVAVNGNPETTLNGLDGASTYDVYVRAICGVGNESGWLGPVSFSTLCASVVAPWSEDFESGTVNTNVVPNLTCWSQEFVTGQSNWRFVAANGNNTIVPNSGSLMAEFRNTSSGTASKLISPSMDLTSLANAQLTFYFANVNWLEDIDELRVYYKQSASDANWTLIDGAVYTAEHAAWEEVVLTLPETEGATDYLIAFEGTSRYARGLNLDDVSITDGPVAACEEVTDVLVSNITENGATISWTDSATAINGYVVNVFLEGVNPITGTPEVTEAVGVGVEAVVIAGLDAGTIYDVYVVSDCGTGETAMSIVVTFTTNEADGCDAVTDIAVTDITENSATVSWTGTSTATGGYIVMGYFAGADPATAPLEFSETVGAGVDATGVTGLEADTSYDVYLMSICGTDSTMSHAVAFTTDQTAGINENEISNIKYFPNPVNNTLTITATKSIDNIFVYNLLGQEVMQAQPRSMTVVLDFSLLPTGAYVLKANAIDSVSSFKVLKK